MLNTALNSLFPKASRYPVGVVVPRRGGGGGGGVVLRQGSMKGTPELCRK